MTSVVIEAKTKAIKVGGNTHAIWTPPIFFGKKEVGAGNYRQDTPR